MSSDVMEDYLKAIHTLERERGPPVANSAIAEYLDVTAPTVTSMLKKLADRDLVRREKYKGVELTDQGERLALEVLRHHRLLESYLAQQLGYEWSEVHEEADALEHHISEEFERRVAAALGDPAIDPHGDPIPNADLDPLAEDDTAPLSACEEDDRVVVARVQDRDPAELDHLADAGVEPGRELRVAEVQPIGIVVVEHEEGRQHLPEDLAARIRVRPAGSAEEVPNRVTEA
ncbi:MAG: metal-dependent transcriptional regulator [Halobacteriaceae archaeon]